MNGRLHLFVIFLCIALFPGGGWVKEDSGESLEKRVKNLEQENQALKEMIRQLQARLNQLENRGTPEVTEPTPPMEEKKEGKEKKKKKEEGSDTAAKESVKSSPLVDGEYKGEEKTETWLPSMFGEQFQLGGRLQFNYYDPENEKGLQSAIPQSPGGSFAVDEFRIYMDADFKNQIRFHGLYDIESGDEDAGLKEAYVVFDELPLSSSLRFGLQPKFFRPGRYTEYYPLPGEAFWRSRDLGITWKGDYAPFYVYLSGRNGTALDTRRLGKDNSAPIIGEDNSDFDLNGGKEFSAGAGVEMDLDRFGKFDVMGFGGAGDLSQADLDFLQQDVPGYGQSNRDTKEYAGANLEYKIGKWDLFSQAITAQDGEMDRLGWYSELSYKFEFTGLRYINSLRPLVRYSALETDLTPRAFSRNGSLTWDRRQWLFALLVEMVRNVSFRAEYALNDEDTGGPDAHNNELLFQLEVRF